MDKQAVRQQLAPRITTRQGNAKSTGSRWYGFTGIDPVLGTKYYTGREMPRYGIEGSPLGNYEYFVRRHTPDEHDRATAAFRKRFDVLVDRPASAVAKEVDALAERLAKGEKLVLTCWCPDHLSCHARDVIQPKVLDRAVEKVLQSNLGKEKSKMLQQQAVQEELTEQVDAAILPTTTQQCLYGFTNLDYCNDYKPSAPNVVGLMKEAAELGYKARCEDLVKGKGRDKVSQTMLTIEFPDAEAMRSFAEEVHPLPIQYRYEGDWYGGFEFLEPDYEKRPVNEQIFETFERDPSFVAGGYETASLKVSGVSFTTQDHGFVVFSDLMVVDIDQPLDDCWQQFQEHCAEHPDQIWAIHSTKKGIHAMRLDTPLCPQEADPGELEKLGIDPSYFDLCLKDEQWTARVTAKSGRLNDRIEFECIVGTGKPDPSLVLQLEAYQDMLVQNGLDTPENQGMLSIALQQASSLQTAREQPAVEASVSEERSELSHEISLEAGSAGFIFSKLLAPESESTPIWFRGEFHDSAWKAYEQHREGLDRDGKVDLMTDITTAKLQQYPNLQSGIVEKGGVDWLEACNYHTTNELGKSWEGRGASGVMMACLMDAHELVAERNQSFENTSQIVITGTNAQGFQGKEPALAKEFIKDQIVALCKREAEFGRDRVRVITGDELGTDTMAARVAIALRDEQIAKGEKSILGNVKLQVEVMVPGLGRDAGKSLEQQEAYARVLDAADVVNLVDSSPYQDPSQLTACNEAMLDRLTVGKDVVAIVQCGNSKGAQQFFDQVRKQGHAVNHYNPIQDVVAAYRGYKCSRPVQNAYGKGKEEQER